MAGAVLSLGSINADFQLRVERWPQPSETLPGRDFLLVSGGKAANVAYAARRFGAAAQLIGRIGDDALGEVALSGPRALGVDLGAVRLAKGEVTGVAMIAVREDGEKVILLAGNANDGWKSDDARAACAAIEHASQGSVLVADLEVPAHVVEDAVRVARKRGFKVVLDPSPASAMTEALYSLVDVATPNASEAAQLAGLDLEQGPEEAAERLRGRFREVLVKARHGDCLLASGEHVRRFKGIRMKAEDATGAGDAFAAALAVGLLEARPIEDAVPMAMAAAALAVTRYGSQASYPDRAALDEWKGRLSG